MLLGALSLVALATTVFAQSATECDLINFVKCTNQLGKSLGFASTGSPTLLPRNGADFVAKVVDLVQQTTPNGLETLCGFSADFFECVGSQTAACFQSDFMETKLGLTSASATIYRGFAAQTHIECAAILQGIPRFSCAGRAEGDHLNPSNECGRAYYTCRGGLAYKAMCPKGQTYDLVAKSCGPITESPRCPGMSNPEPEVPMRLPKYSCPTPDGVFPNDKLVCSMFYYKCSYDQAVLTACDLGKLFDIRSLTCMDARDIPACIEVTTTLNDPITTTTAYYAPTTTTIDESPPRDPTVPAQSATGCDLINFVKCTNQLGKSLGFTSTGAPTLLPLNGADFVAKVVDLVQQTTPNGLEKLCGFAADFFECVGSQTAACFQSDFLETMLGLTSASATIYRGFAAQTHIECAAILQGIPRFSCAGRAEGDHLNPSNECGRAYYTCRGGLAYKAMCPKGQTYDLVAKSCGPISASPRCPGMINPVPEVPMRLPKYSCPTPDGVFPNDKLVCSMFYYKCSYDQAVLTACDLGKLFDIRSLTCMDARDIPACIEVTTTLNDPITTTTAYYAPTTTPYYAPTTTTIPPRDPTTTPYYAPTTTPYYAPITTTIPPRDPTTTPYYAPTTTPYYAPTTTPYALPPQRDVPIVNPYSKKPYTPGPAYPTPSYAFDCSKQYDGDYPNPEAACSDIFYSCVGGITSERHCTPGTRYNVETVMCDYPEYVPACGGHPTQPTISTPAADPELPPLLDCTNLKSGNYEHPTEKCSSTYVSCVGGKAITRWCPANLKYDVTADYCDHKRWVPACGGVATTTVTPIVSTTLPLAFDCTDKDDKNYPDPANKCSQSFYSCVGGWAVAQMCFGSTKYDAQMDKCEFPNFIPDCGGLRTEPPTTTTTTPEPSGPKFDCVKLEMGNHPEASCSKWYWVCSGGPFGIKMNCPEGTFFDRELNQCGYHDNIPECSGKPRTTTIQQDASSVTPAYPFECPSVGNFPDPKEACSHHFISCDGAFGRAQLRTCSASLYYDKIADMCMPYMETPACNPNPRTTTYKAVYPVTVTAPLRDPLPFTCPAPEGFFAPVNEKCPTYGWKCSYGVASRFPCPPSQVFSKHKSICVPISEVKACQQPY